MLPAEKKNDARSHLDDASPMHGVRRATSTALALAVALAPALACEREVPEIQREIPDIVLPSKKLDKQGSVLALQASAEDSATDDEEEGECLSWITVEETYNATTGAFRYEYACEEGGDLAGYVTEGVDDFEGNGHYTQTLMLRDGGEIVWNYTYTLGADGMSQIYDGVSSEGETHHSIQTYLADESVHVEETWGLIEGVYTTNGTYDDEGRFNGTSSFDDPNTEASPDYTLEQSQGFGCEFSQVVDGVFENTATSYSYTVDIECVVSYVFVNDDLSTLASPDFDGGYTYQADGSGEGSYLQNLDDGSHIEVADAFTADGVVTQSWLFDDVATEVAIDQEGAIVYQPDGTGEGSVTYHFDDGDSQTCAVVINADGETIVSDCD